MPRAERPVLALGTRVAVCLFLTVALAGCGGDGSDDGLPSKSGTSARYASSWMEHASEQCTNSASFSCGFRAGARDDDLPAAQAPNSNFVIAYDGTDDDPDLNGWAVALAYSERHNCYGNGLTIEEPLPENLWGMMFRCED